MQKITRRQKIGLIFLGIFLALVFLELGLRVGGTVITTIRNPNNKITGNVVGSDSDEEYRILWRKGRSRTLYC